MVKELMTIAMSNRFFLCNELHVKAYASLADESCLWHKRMGHVNYRSLSLLHKMNLVEDMSKVDVKMKFVRCISLESRLDFNY